MQFDPIQIQSTSNDWSHSAVLGQRGAAGRNFADLVAARLVGAVLPYRERESLVRTAARSGISRFEANLIIAAVQHEMGGRRNMEYSSRTRHWRISPALAACIATQAAIVLAVWYLLF